MQITKKIRLWVWQVTHVYRYSPEIRHFFWCGRIKADLRRDALCRKCPILVYLSVWGQFYYVIPIIRELKKYIPNLSVYIALDQPGTQAMAKEAGVPFRRFRPLRAYAAFAGFRVFITPSLQLPFKPIISPCIGISHGIPAKGVDMEDKYIRFFDTLFLSSPLHRILYDEYAAAYPETAGHLRVFQVGYPKSDALIRGEYSRERVLNELRLDSRRKTVLFAPAFDRGTSLPRFGTAIFDALAELPCNVVVKLHPVCYNPQYLSTLPGGVNWSAILEKYNELPHFRHVGNVALDPYLAACDVMVTDVSSAAWEGILLDRPLIYIDCPEFYAQMGSETYPYQTSDPANDIRVNAGRSVGVVVSNMEEMKAAIVRSLDKPGERSDARRKIKDLLLYNPGHAADVAAKTIVELLERKTK